MSIRKLTAGQISNADELYDYLDTEPGLAYRRSLTKSLLTDIRNDKYDENKACKKWNDIVDFAARAYIREYCCELNFAELDEVFPKKVRKLVAERWMEDEYVKMIAGDRDGLDQLFECRSCCSFFDVPSMLIRGLCKNCRNSD